MIWNVNKSIKQKYKEENIIGISKKTKEKEKYKR